MQANSMTSGARTISSGVRAVTSGARTVARGALLCALAATLLSAAPAACRAQQGRVEMQVGTEPGFDQLATREWYELLTALKVANLRIAGATPGDKIEIQTTGTERSPVYVVHARLTASGQLIVPGGRFSLRSRDSLSKWLDGLRKDGPDGPKVDTTGSTFGMDDEQLKLVQKDLAHQVDFSTVDKERDEIVEQLAAKLSYPVKLSEANRRALKAAGKLKYELKDVAAGTALAYVIRAAGLGMAPHAAGGSLEYQIAPADALQQQWPIGFDSKKRVRDIMPNSFEIVDFQVNPNTPLVAALPPIAEYLQTSFLFDENQLAAAEMDPAKIAVSMNPQKTALSIAASRLIGQARMRSSVRIDENGRAFYWITPLLVPKRP